MVIVRKLVKSVNIFQLMSSSILRCLYSFCFSNTASSEQTFYNPALADNVLRQTDSFLEIQGQAGHAIQDLPVNPVTGPEAYTPVEKDDMIENLVALYNANKDVTNRLRVLKIIEGMMLKNEAMAKFLIQEDFCQGNFFQKYLSLPIWFYKSG